MQISFMFVALQVMLYDAVVSVVCKLIELASKCRFHVCSFRCRYDAVVSVVCKLIHLASKCRFHVRSLRCR